MSTNQGAPNPQEQSKAGASEEEALRDRAIRALRAIHQEQPKKERKRLSWKLALLFGGLALLIILAIITRMNPLPPLADTPEHLCQAAFAPQASFTPTKAMSPTYTLFDDGAVNGWAAYHDFPSGKDTGDVDQANTLICIQWHDSFYGFYTDTRCGTDSEAPVNEVQLDVRLVGRDGKVLNENSFTGPTPPFAIPEAQLDCAGNNEYGLDTVRQAYQDWLKQVLT